MLKTYNCGIGMILVVNKSEQKKCIELLRIGGEQSYVIGQVTKRNSQAVIVRNFDKAANKNVLAIHQPVKPIAIQAKKKVAVLISGSGTNLKAIIDHVNNNKFNTAIELSLVIADKSTAKGIQFAQDAGIPTRIITKSKTQSRKEYDMSLHEELLKHKIEVVCLAGFMKILSEQFVNLWLGRIVNIHPSLLPSFKGMDAYGQALKAGVKVTGCTVHFVIPEMDAGQIILQEPIRINADDTHDSLAQRGKAVEHTVYPQALELVCSSRVSMKF